MSGVQLLFVMFFLPVTLTIILLCQTIGDIRRKKRGLPPKKHNNIKDLNIVEVIVHDTDD